MFAQLIEAFFVFHQLVGKTKPHHELNSADILQRLHQGTYAEVD
jgi:hypothetical protein